MASDFITLAQAKQYLQIDPAQTGDDGMIAAFISGASQEFLTITSLPYLALTTFTERRNGTGTAQMTMRNRPLQSITSLVINNLPVKASPDGVAAGYVFDPGGIIISLVGGYSAASLPFLAIGYQGYPGCFSRGYGNVFINGTAGYPNLPAVLFAIVPQAQPPSAVIYYTNPALTLMNVAAGATVLNENTNQPLALVTGTPITGQYALLADGTFVFAAADTGVPVKISYSQNGVPVDVQKCCYEMVGWAYKSRDRIGKQSAHFADSLTETYRTTPFSDMSKLTIRQYTRKDSIIV